MRPSWGLGQSPRSDMARPTTGPALVHRLAGSDLAKRRTELVLATLAGTCTVEDAAAALEIDRSYLFVLRDQILSGAVAAAEPRTPGPKPLASQPDGAAELRSQVIAAEKRAKDAEIALELERVRVELAMVMGPRLKKNRWRHRQLSRVQPPNRGDDSATPR